MVGLQLNFNSKEFKSIECVTNEDKITKYLSESWLVGHDALKSKLTKTVQWNALLLKYNESSYFEDIH